MSTNTVSFECDFCHKEFSKDRYCKRHIRDVHKRNSQGELRIEELKHKFTCHLCGKEYKQKCYLQKHVSAVHSSEKHIYICDQCTFKTVYKTNLKRHFLNKHINRKESQFQCTRCDSKYKYKKHLKYHERKIHKIGNPLIVVKRLCPICKYTVIGQTEKCIYKHFENCHSILMKWERHDFDSMVKFNDWKRAIEKNSTTFFIKTSSSTSACLYRCHRCGFYRKRGFDKRHIKRMGSCKINGFCPSMIKVKLDKKDSVSILYLSTHVGHLNELKHIRLTREERESVASKVRKHIHLGARTINNSNNDEAVVETSNLIMNVLENDKTVVEHAILNEVCQESENIMSVEAEKEKLFHIYKDIETKLKTVDEINLVKTHLTSVIPTLEAVQSGAKKY